MTVRAARLPRLPTGLPRPTRPDVALGLFVAVAVSVVLSLVGPETETARGPDAGAYLLALGLGALMLVRRRWPVATLLATFAILAVYYSAEYPPVGVALPIAAALYSTAEAGRLRWAVVLAAGFLALTTSIRWAEGDERAGYLLGYELVTSATLVAAVIALGDAVRSRRGWQAEIQRRTRQAEIEREREASRRLQEERVRIARELHDALAHTVSVITVQADVASEAVDDDPGAVRAAIGAIRNAGGDALQELRGTVKLLRDHDAPEPRSPPGGLAQLDRIAGAAKDSGLDVTVRVEGEPVTLPAVVDAAAHRIVQESITNVLRHAGARSAEIAVGYGGGALTVSVTDDGRGHDGRGDDAGDGPGFGLRGMRERVALLGGRFRAGPGPHGGFLVEASLPVPGTS